MSNVQNQQDSIYKSLQQFLFRKNLITQAVLAMARDSGEVWNNTFDEAYKSFATHRLGIHAPQIPATVFQVDPRILEDADWVFLEQEDAGAGAHAVPATTRESQFQEQTPTQAVQSKTDVSNTENTDLNAGKVDQQGYISVARQLTERFGFKKVAITLRGSISASDNDWAGMLYSDGKACFSPTYRVHIVDRVGGGDSFGGGLIYALLSDYDDQKAINFAVAASCLKHSLEHDFNLVSVAEVESLAGGNASGRVQR